MKNDFLRLAFTPLQINPLLSSIDMQELMSFVYEKSTPHYPYPTLWDALTFCGAIDDFSDPIECDSAWNARYNLREKEKISVNPIFPEKIRALLLHLLQEFPYQRCTYAQFLIQKVDIPPHQDGLYEKKHIPRQALQETPYGFSEQMEPSGLKVIFSEALSKNFYVANNVKGKREYIRMPSDTICFAVNERTFFHGSKKPEGRKIILSTFGVIDTQKHENLLRRSTERYEQYSIWF